MLCSGSASTRWLTGDRPCLIYFISRQKARFPTVKMKTRRKKPTSDAVSAAREILADFFRTYSLGKQDELIALLIATLCNLSDVPTVSRNRRLEAIKYLNALSDVLISAR